MEDISLSVSLRERAGSGAAGRIRREGKIPAVIYGTSGSRNLSVDRSTFLQVWRKAGQSSIVMIDDGNGFSTMSLIQDVQRNPLTDDFMHIDFLEVNSGHAISAHIPIHIHGTAKGVSNEGGVLDIQLHEVEVRCLPKDLPHQIDVDVSELALGDVIHVKDLPATEGVEYLGEEEAPVVAVTHAAAEETEDDEEESEVEIISEKKTETEESED
ncbi:50S ribosomal protein L25 [Puniceicoccus vermicola]|uniref:Large ribosomal subunit protein bL25 n=1 Tax=Puniceicoccus vermicola TaxID=388746 RepID=A0A7X1AYM6_9BACT|nr:50S ribosomal protein L25 [Puniceicoccus vermicola]MBC2602393.1 50S ribosomal protein L25 [Puniceicoccus vermicola]